MSRSAPRKRADRQNSPAQAQQSRAPEKNGAPFREAAGANRAVSPPPAAATAPLRPGLRHHALPGVLFALTLALDHLTKFWAIAALSLAHPETGARLPAKLVSVIPGALQFRYAENTGAAFSLFYEHPEILTGVSALIAIALFVWYFRTALSHRWTRAGLALILGGAVGNLIDRAARGYVVDFIDAYWRQWHWPAFNIADSAICIGAGILILLAHKEHSGAK